jgi:NOL1/NOP2/fmu family ribosome biogenesis protein
MRRPTFDEETAVLGFFEAMEKGLAAKVLGLNDLAVVERDGNRFVCLVGSSLHGLPEELLVGADAAGLPIGTLEDGAFHLDLQGAVLLARKTERQTVRVTEHAARLFLYGRNVLGDSVERHDPRLEQGDACIVTNPRGEAMGIGVVVGPFKGGRESVKPVVDLGTYLRDQDEGEE